MSNTKGNAKKGTQEKTSGNKSTSMSMTNKQSEKSKILDPVELSKRLEVSTKNIRKEIGGVAKSFCKIGYELLKVRDEKLYIGQKFNNVYEYGEAVFGFQKSSVGNYISVCERFSLKKNEKPTAQLSPDFANYTYGQLSLMLSLPPAKLADVTPDKTCKEIREIKKAVTIEKGLNSTSRSASSAPASSPAPADVADTVVYNVSWTYKDSPLKSAQVTHKKGDDQVIFQDILVLLKNQWFDFGRDGDSLTISLAGGGNESDK